MGFFGFLKKQDDDLMAPLKPGATMPEVPQAPEQQQEDLPDFSPAEIEAARQLEKIPDQPPQQEPEAPVSETQDEIDWDKEFEEKQIAEQQPAEETVEEPAEPVEEHQPTAEPETEEPWDDELPDEPAKMEEPAEVPGEQTSEEPPEEKPAPKRYPIDGDTLYVPVAEFKGALDHVKALRHSVRSGNSGLEQFNSSLSQDTEPFTGFAELLNSLQEEFIKMDNQLMNQR